MEEQVKALIRKTGMIAPGDHVIVSVSGGPDSVVLLHLLCRAATELRIRLHVFHMDHGLRGESSAGDASYVASLAEGLGVPVTIVRLEAGVLKSQIGSLQANARSVRYREINALATRIGANRVALGHNRDDQAETVLMRFLRGAGPSGLAGIPLMRMQEAVTYVRPLLETSRSDIEAYCKKHELFPRLDASNLTPAYFRNRIRLDLLPQLAAAYNPAVVSNLAQIANLLRAEDQFLTQLTEEALQRCRVPGPGVALLGDRLAAEPLALARRVVRRAAREVAGPEYDLGFEAVSRVLDLTLNPSGSHQLCLPGGVEVTAEYGLFHFSLPESQEALPVNEWPVALTGETMMPELGLRLIAEPPRLPRGPLEAAFDLERLPGPLSIRLRLPGDRIWPVGMRGSKKLQDLLVDAKVPRRLRDRVPLLVSGDDILWVLGQRLDRRYLATQSSRKVLFLRVVEWEAAPGD